MAFRDFFRSDRDRDRDEDERGRERWRSQGGDWRDENRGRRDWERGEERDQGYGAEHGWSPGSEHYSDRSQDYRAGYDEGERGERWGRERDERSSRWGHQRGGGFGGGEEGSSGPGRWSEDQQRYGGYSGRGAGRSYGEVGYGRDMDHRGKGPRGYRRSDQRIKEDVCDCLTEDAYIDASNMEVVVAESQVTLSGTVNSRDEKRRAEDLILRILGVTDVTNNLRVAPQQPPQPSAENTSPSARH